jgi:Domain of unknown function (DUF4349)
MDMTTSLARVAAVLAVPILALSACSSGSTHDSAARRASGAADSVAGSAGQLADTAGEPAPAAAGKKAPPALEQSIISTGSVSLASKNVEKARADVQHIADAYAGQISDQETTTAEDKKVAHARLVLRIPARSFGDAMAALEQVGDLVDSETTSEDVSTQVIDVDERVKAARASIDRIRTLLTRAERIGDVMAIESQLASREADLNSLLRQQAHLADQTALSTISVNIERRSVATAENVSAHTGFLTGLAAGWQALRGFATGLATVLGALLPWAPVIALVGAPLWLVVRRVRRTTPVAAPTIGEG